MATVATKRKLNTKSIKEKYAALKEVEEGSAKSQVAIKYGIPKNTLSTWIKSKEKIFEAMKTQGNISKRRRLKEGTFAHLDDLIFKWLLTVRSRNVVVSPSILKTKAKELAEKIEHSITRIIFLVPWRSELSGVYCIYIYEPKTAKTA